MFVTAPHNKRRTVSLHLPQPPGLARVLDTQSDRGSAVRTTKTRKTVVETRNLLMVLFDVMSLTVDHSAHAHCLSTSDLITLIRLA